ncbi:fibronectin type III domain-containing protein, partial [Streptomyces sp. NPDC002920]
MTVPSRGTPPGPPVPDVGIPPRLARGMSMAEQYEYLRTRLTRRRTLVTAGAVAAGGLLTGCGGDSPAPRTSTSPTPSATGNSSVTPFGRHLAFGADPRTQMRISWQVPAAVRTPYVRIGTRPDDLGGKVRAEVRDLHTPGIDGVRGALDQYYVHAAVADLLPGTTY